MTLHNSPFNVPDSPLIDVATLAERLGSPKLCVIDASWYLPADQRDTYAEYLIGHIPGAVFFDLDAHSDRSNPLPHMLADRHAFESAVRGLGVGADDLIVVYDSAGIFSAARVWWNFRVMGATNVAVLDGGLKQWNAQGQGLETGTVERPKGDFTARFDPALVRNFDAVVDLVSQGGASIVDARGAARFRGDAPEPRAGLVAGHIPGSRNVPFSDLVGADGRMRPPSQIAMIFTQAGVALDAPIVTTCGSGVTAAVLALGLASIGRSDVAVYDGSWAEWGSDARSADLIATGA